MKKTFVLIAMATMAVPFAGHSGTLQDENLIVGVPSGFTIAVTERNGPTDLSEFVPTGETVKDWSRMVTVQIFHNMGGAAPTVMAEGIRIQWLASCPGSEVNKVKDVVENGYDATLWLFTCPLNARTGKPETMFTKITGGADALYSVQYAYRASLTRDIIPPTMTYLGGVRVCDTRRADRPCPGGM